VSVISHRCPSRVTTGVVYLINYEHDPLIFDIHRVTYIDFVFVLNSMSIKFT